MTGRVMRSANAGGGIEPAPSPRRRIVRPHAGGGRVDHEAVAGGIGRAAPHHGRCLGGEALHQRLAPFCDRCRRSSASIPRPRSAPAPPRSRRPPPRPRERAGRPPRERGASAATMAVPSVMSPPQRPGAMRYRTLTAASRCPRSDTYVAVAQRGEFMRDRDDDAIDVLDRLCGPHEGVEIARRHMHRNAHRIDAARGEFRREPGRRFGLGDRIADDEVQPGLASEGWKHLDPFAVCGRALRGRERGTDAQPRSIDMCRRIYPETFIQEMATVAGTVRSRKVITRNAFQSRRRAAW